MEQKHDGDDATSPDLNVPLQGEIGGNNNDVGDNVSCMNPDESDGVEFARVMEKRKIREEMIASEMIRLRKLEDEVRREVMIERRNSMGMRNFNGFSNYVFMGVGPHNWPNYLLNLGTSDDKSTTNTNMLEDVMPDEAKATPSAGIIGKKRKAEMPFEEDTTPTMSRDSEKFCTLCGVSTTSELTMNSHLQGRKHKAKEARFKANNTTSSLQHVSTLISEQENSSDTKEWDCSLCQVSVTSEALLKSHLQGKKHKAKEAKLQTGEIIDSIQLTSAPSSGGNATDSDNQWYCSLCGVAASSENNLNAHLQGKKHKAKAGSTEKVSKMEVMRDKSLDKEEILKDEENPDNAISELSKDEPAEAEKKQASLPEDILGREGLEVDGDESVELVKYWHCKMCNKGTRDEATMVAHRKSDEHMTLLRKHGGGLISVKTIPKEVVEDGGMSREGL